MYIWAQDKMSFVNSENVTAFCFEEHNDNYEIWADLYVIGVYFNKDDGVKALNDMFKSLEAGSTSYQMD